MIPELEKLAAQVKLSPVHRILLTTDGSITRILEALEGCEVQVETVHQEVVKAKERIAKLLRIAGGEEVNHRIVNLRSCRRILVRATSYAPLKRLEPRFRDAVMRADIPIGKIMAELEIESRREILSFSAFKANSQLASVFGIAEGELLLERNYTIIHRRKPLLYITEVFPHSFF
jgi:beta-ribofuranosylaminobenzene 5'-phosphate synthase